MKDWQEILCLYEKDNLYLAEAAQMLIRNINYEIPALKKQIQKFKQILVDLEKKEAEYKKLGNIAKSDFNNFCKQLGIAGIDIKRELVEKVYQLPEIYDVIAKNAKSLNISIEFYSEFVKFTLENYHSSDCVPLIKYLIDKGNTTTYEWIYGEAPLTIDEPSLNFNLNDQILESDKISCGSSKVEEIDFGLLDLNMTTDYREELLISTEDTIDWGEIGEVSTFTSDKNSTSMTLEESGILVEAVGCNAGHAYGALAYRILDNPDTRDEFINQLMELETFLQMRLYEYKNDGDKNLIIMGQMQDTSIFQLASLESTQNMLDSVHVLISEILDNKIHHLHNMKHSSRYVDVLFSNLSQKQKLIKKMESLQKMMQKKQIEISNQTESLGPTLKLIIQKTKDLQLEIEDDISKKYKNRKVRLTGGINTI